MSCSEGMSPGVSENILSLHSYTAKVIRRFLPSPSLFISMAGPSRFTNDMVEALKPPEKSKVGLICTSVTSGQYLSIMGRRASKSCLIPDSIFLEMSTREPAYSELLIRVENEFRRVE